MTEELSRIAILDGSSGAMKSRTRGVGTPKSHAFSGRGGRGLPVMARERAVHFWTALEYPDLSRLRPARFTWCGRAPARGDPQV